MNKNTLILYYSLTGITETVAKELQALLGADIEHLTLEHPYTGTFDDIIKQTSEEMKSGISPKLIPLKHDLSQYNTIFLGYPIWFDTYASPITTLLKDYDLAGKKIVTFSTYGSGGQESAIRSLRESLPQSDVAEIGFGIRDTRLAALPKELNRFLIENKYLDGAITPLPDYSEMQPVTEEEIKIFNAACGNYHFPLGTPILAGKRTTDESIDYMYEVENNGRNIIYVTIESTPEAKPEFTKVVR